MCSPLLNVFNHSLEVGSLPKTLTVANTSLILKKDTLSDKCSGLLNSDFKLNKKEWKSLHIFSINFKHCSWLTGIPVAI